MARTLIGNIKGKDGRGITSIEKTGTTGPVDTYTITYTDGTTSTFTVNNSDNIALQRQIVPSAAVESSATASQAYAAGDYVVVNGILRKVKSSIVKGNAISDSNSTATTVTGELATIGDSVPRLQFGNYHVGKLNKQEAKTVTINVSMPSSNYGIALTNSTAVSNWTWVRLSIKGQPDKNSFVVQVKNDADLPINDVYFRWVAIC